MTAIAGGLKRANHSRVLSAEGARFVGLLLALVHTLIFYPGYRVPFDAYYAGASDDEAFMFHGFRVLIFNPLPVMAVNRLEASLVGSYGGWQVPGADKYVYQDVVLLLVTAFYWFLAGYCAVRLLTREMKLPQKLAWSIAIPMVVVIWGFLMMPERFLDNLVWYPLWFGPPLVILLGAANTIAERMRALRPAV